jgi:hypothetical protein
MYIIPPTLLKDILSPKKIVAIIKVKIGKAAIRSTTTEGSPNLSV